MVATTPQRHNATTTSTEEVSTFYPLLGHYKGVYSIQVSKFSKKGLSPNNSWFNFDMELTGLVLIQLLAIEVSEILVSKFVNPGCLKHRLFRAVSFFAEVCNLRRIFPDVGTTNMSSWNRIRNLGSLRKIFVFLVSNCWVHNTRCKV